MKVIGFIVIIFLICFGNSFSLELSLNSADTAPYSTTEGKGFYDVLLKEVFGSIGINIRINHLLSERSIQNANSGIDDGEFARIEGMSAEYNNLIPVPETLVNFYFTAFTKNPDILISSWKDLSGYNIAFINGWKIFENNVPENANIIRVKDAEALFRMLLTNRVDLILYSKGRGSSKIINENLTDIHIIDPPLSIRGMYLYINSKHRDIVSDITTALRALKENGRYMEIMNEYLRFQ